MFAVRYLALAALVVWLGGTILMLAQTVRPNVRAPFDLVSVLCGATIIGCLVVMKFVGPPPRAFPMRAGLTFVMTALALYAGVFHRDAAMVMAVNVAVGLVLLAWYAGE